MVHDCFCSASLEDLQLTLVGVSVGKPHINEFSARNLSDMNLRVQVPINYKYPMNKVPINAVTINENTQQT